MTRLPFEPGAASGEGRPPAMALGPWCWSVHAAGAPEMTVGIAPAVTLRGGTVALWALTSAPVPASLAGSVHRAALGAEATASWDAAVLALEASAPLMELVSRWSPQT